MKHWKAAFASLLPSRIIAILDVQNETSRASSLNTGSIILHVAHVAHVSIATTARCEPSTLRNDVGFVDGWMVVVAVGRVVAERAR